MKKTLSLVFRQTANNTMIVVLDWENKIIKWSSVRRTFKDLKKKQLYYNKMVVSFLEKCLEFVQEIFKHQSLTVFNKIIFRGAVRKPRRFLLMLIRSFFFFRIVIVSGHPPHNGCQLRKRRKGFGYRTFRRARGFKWL